MTTVLIVDDVRPMAEQYAYDLKRIGGFETLVAFGGDEALATLTREAVDCVVLDLEMPGKDGFAVLRAMRDRGIETPVVVYTGTGDYDRCAQAIRLGAYSFVDKADPVARVAREVENAVERRMLVSEVVELRRYAAEDTALRGTSPAMKKLKESIARVAPIPSTVLIVGESGSGKELVARDVHRLSGGGREREPFVAVNCGALAESLIESELFGHERGAFTGANATRKGAFESAGKGTIFLDEIGELPSAAQAKLLRVLEERQVVRVGSTHPIAAPARVIAATHRDLEADVAAGRFRQDLLFRLAVHVLRVPPLRDRLSDLPELVDHILTVTCARFGIKRKTITADALELLTAYDWKRNNVRELRNVVERMLIAADGDVIGPEQVPAEIVEGASLTTPGAEARTFLERKAEAERQIVVAALERNEWHITRTAHDLGLADHASLLKIMRRHGIASR
ncbi:MAG TPA: sigma-54 dependent transcriptional regulator [Gemmatimonadaceae bacterium]|nr:sigma-54 dependent transcriptional regulator [Gemmatimonadaceae bacterium]